MTFTLKILNFLLLLNVSYGSEFKTSDFYRNIDRDLGQYDSEFGSVTNREQLLTWNYLTNITAENANQLKHFRQTIYDWKQAWNAWAPKQYTTLACDHIINLTALENNTNNNQFIKRCFYLRKMMSSVRFVNSNELSLFSALRSGLSEKYANLNVRVSGRTLVGETEITRFISESENLNEIKSAWNQWYENSSAMLPMFVQLLNLLNKTTSLNGNGYDLWDTWVSDLGMTQPLKYAHKLWSEVQQFYMHLHGYVRAKLRDNYGSNDIISSTESIPIYLIKSLWADQWNSVIDITRPFESKHRFAENDSKHSTDNINELLAEAQKLYTDLGFEKLSDKFWQNSVFTKPDRNTSTIIDCHPLAFDFMDGSDFRVKLCLTGDLKHRETELRKVVHEFGHIYYFKSYSTVPNLFRSAPMSAFHEAIGDLMVLISNACKWQNSDYREVINGQMSEALNNFVIIPWALALEQWRHDLFTENFTIQSANRHYWNIRDRLQGIKPPTERYFAYNLDPIAKYHVSNFMPYLRYFYSRFLSHQFHRALCPQTEIPLYRCCPRKISENFWKLLSTGSMMPWKELLNHLTGSFDIISAPLLDYYKPLIEWLINTNVKNNYPIGWN